MFNRRHFIAGAAATSLAAPAILSAQSIWRRYPFNLGVAAGDPSPDGFVIWTRLAPEPLAEHGGMAMQPLAGELGSRLGRPLRDHRRARRCGGAAGSSAIASMSRWRASSPTGLIGTVSGRAASAASSAAPGRCRCAGSSPAALKFGVAGCQAYDDGYYTAYRHLAGEELAFVYHYGDYIYEYRNGTVRPGWTGGVSVAVRESVGDMLHDIADYRRRYAQIKSDPELHPRPCRPCLLPQLRRS